MGQLLLPSIRGGPYWYARYLRPLDGDYRILQIVQITEKQVHLLILTNENLKLMFM
jgi:hypothetical protein